jgi:hypothetical protein
LKDPRETPGEISFPAFAKYDKIPRPSPRKDSAAELMTEGGVLFQGKKLAYNLQYSMVDLSNLGESMAFLNPANNELQIKIVYAGPGRSGKTTNLECLYNKLRDRSKSKLVAIDTYDEKTRNCLSRPCSYLNLMSRKFYNVLK